MENILLLQLYYFLIYLISGIVIGILFDVFRILRRTFKTSDLVTYIEDGMFWLLTGIFLLFILFKFTDGQIRIYNIVGLVIGIIFYMLLFSKFFININVKILTFFKNIIYRFTKIIIYPIKKLLKLISKLINPFTFFVINIKKSIKNFSIKIPKMKNKREKRATKEGF